MLIGRKSDQEWLQRQMRLSRLILLTGLRGVGKTHLVRHFLQSQGIKFLWFTAERFKDLPELLGHPDTSVEAALEKGSERWRNHDLIVWDEIHLLPPSARRPLLSFLKNSPYLPTQIFLSDEELQEASDASADLVHRRLQPFSAAEIREYSEAVEIRLAEGGIEELMQRTGGLPLLLRLWAQEQDSPGSFKNRLVESLSAEELDVLGFASMINRHFSSHELSTVTGRSWDVCESLRRKCLLEQAPGEIGTTCCVPGYVRGLVLQTLSREARQDLSRRICSLMTEPSLEHCLHALRSEMPALIESALSTSLIDRLEHLGREDLQDIASLLKDTPRGELGTEARLITLRMELRALLLLGNREQAIQTGETEAAQLEASGGLASKSAEYFLVELIQILNRSGQSSRARAWIAKSPNVNASLLQLEQAASWMPGEPKRAQEILEKVLARGALNEMTLPQAQARFQLARAYDLQQVPERAEENYRAALIGFRQADKPYFAAVTLLNIGWIVLKAQRWDALAKIRQELAPIAIRYGYLYVQAGLELIEATEARLHLQYGRALQKAESALKRLGASAPLLARFDAQGEYIQVLIALGLYARAKASLDEFTRTLGPGLESTLKSRLAELGQEIASPRMTSEEWLESHDPSTETSEILCQQRGLDLKNAKSPTAPLAQLAQLELQLTRTLQDQGADEAWPLIARMERLLEQTPEPMAEKIALLILQALLVREENQRAPLLDRAELELKRWAADAEIQAPLRALLDCARAPQSRPIKLNAYPLWAKALPGLRERWKRWLVGSLKTERSPWLLITPSGHKELDEEPTRDPQVTLQIFEHVAEVFWKGKRVSEFHRRHALRKLLALVIEQGEAGADKSAIATVVWGESYDPRIHDARIYTAVQRLRSLLRTPDAIQSWSGAYRWNPALPYRLVRRQRPAGDASVVAVSDTRTQGLIIQALERSTQGGRLWIARGELVAATQSSEATVKRELSKLLSASLISRQGQGRGVVYSLRRGA